MPVGKFEFKKLSLSPTCDGAFFSAPKTTKRSESVIDYKEVDSTCDMTANALAKEDNVDCEVGMGKCKATTADMDKWVDDNIYQSRATKRTKFDSNSLIGATILVQCNAEGVTFGETSTKCIERHNIEDEREQTYENDSDKSDCDNGSASTSSSVQIIPPPINDKFVELYVDISGDDCTFKIVITENYLL